MSMKKLIELDDFEGIKKAVIAGEDVNSTDRSGATALMRAIVKMPTSINQKKMDGPRCTLPHKKVFWMAFAFCWKMEFMLTPRMSKVIHPYGE